MPELDVAPPSATPLLMNPTAREPEVQAAQTEKEKVA
jgi:hypothetical protein